MTTPTWTVVVPVKALSHAKSRLDSPLGRAELARAFALDVIGAALACPRVETVIVVTSDESAAEDFASAGAVVIGEPQPGGLNESLAFVAKDVAGPLCAIAGDLPALTVDELTRALDRASGFDRSFETDAAGIGTTMLCTLHGQELKPQFGGRSRAAHSASGALELKLPHAAGLRRDVDTEIDLWDAIRIGLGRHSRALMEQSVYPATVAGVISPDDKGTQPSSGLITLVNDAGLISVVPISLATEGGLRTLRVGQRVSVDSTHGRLTLPGR